MKKRPLIILVAGIVISLLTVWYAYASFILQPPQTLELLAQVGGVTEQPLAEVKDVFAIGDLVYALDENSLVILDVSEPNTPRILSQLSLPGQGKNLIVNGNQAYMSIESTKDIHIIDVTHPESPVQKKVIHLEGDYENGFITDIFAMQDRLYILMYGTLFGVDLNGDESPTEIWDGSGGYVGEGHLFVREENGRRYAYLTDVTYSNDPEFWYHHYILDITDETSIKEMSRFSTSNTGGDIIVNGDFAYMSGGYFYDVSDPANPVAAGYFSSLGKGIDISDVHLYGVTSSVYVLDISNLAFFPVLAESPEGQGGMAISISNEIAFVAGGEEGLLVYRYLPRTVFAQRWEAEDGTVAPQCLFNMTLRPAETPMCLVRMPGAMVASHSNSMRPRRIIISSGLGWRGRIGVITHSVSPLTTESLSNMRSAHPTDNGIGRRCIPSISQHSHSV